MNLETSAALWDYAVAVYARPGVRELCLRLQDEHKLDVNVLLAAAWAAGVGIALDARSARLLDDAARPVRERFTTKIRELRRAAIDDPELKQHLLAAELRAERLALAAIHAELARMPRSATPPQIAANLAACAPGEPEVQRLAEHIVAE